MSLRLRSRRLIFCGAAAAVAVLVALAGAGIAGAATIFTESFESPSIPTYQFGAPPNWTTNANGAVGLNNTSWSSQSPYFYPTATNGVQVAFVGGGGGGNVGDYLLQSPTTIQSNTTYTLQVDVGSPPGYTGTYAVSLVDGSTLGLITLGTPATGTANTAALQTVTATYNSPALNPIAGDLLGIQLELTSNTASQVLFDNVRLDGTPVSVPEPGSLALLTLGGLFSLVKFSRRKRHGASRNDDASPRA